LFLQNSESSILTGVLEIKESRTKAWEHVASRYHSIVKVFSATNDGSDLLMIGKAVLVLKNGKKLEGDFLARVVIEGITTSDQRMSFFQAWGVRLFLFSERRDLFSVFSSDNGKVAANKVFRTPAR
jgi:hypothetical protein